MPDEFYNKLGDDYELMTDPEKRMQNEKPFFEELIKKYGIKTAVDIGCGTGHHVKMFSQDGIFTYGIDPSSGLLETARKNLKGLEKYFKLVQSDFEDLNRIVKKPVTAVFCIGNTLPNLLSEERLISAISKSFDILENKGVFVIQVVNYSKILKKKERILKINRKNNVLFIRFYDFLETYLRFNILRIIEEGETIQNSLISTYLYPWEKDKIVELLEKAGFSKITAARDYHLNPFETLTSDNLVIIAQK
ncbi:class I SAM-dependent methyltransferase [candidate division KSB1 bacterium]